MDLIDSTDGKWLAEKAKDIGAIATWSEEKKKDFVNLFQQRSEVTHYLLCLTAYHLIDRAVSKKFVSEKHTKTLPSIPWKRYTSYYGCGQHSNDQEYHGRRVEELKQLAKDRAEAVLGELPPLKQAVRIIEPEVAKKMDVRDKLLADGLALQAQLDEVSKTIRMSEVDQAMTVADFRKMVKERADKRDAIFIKLRRIGTDGSELEGEINKALYSGLPGLSDAVIQVIKDHIERATALDQTTRRVTEQVMFGDSEAALEMLKRFEQDEAEVSSHIKAEFSAALEKLKLAAKKNKQPKTAAKQISSRSKKS